MTAPELHLLRAGRPGAATVVWLHGYTMSSEVWRPLWRRLPGLRHVGVDLPSHGRSVSWSPQWGLDDVGSMIAKVCQQESARALVAMSFGSTVALQTLIDHPYLVDRAVLAAATPAGPADDPAAADRIRQLVRAKRLGLLPEAVARLWMTSPPDIFTGLAAHPTAFGEMSAVVTRHPFEELVGPSMRQAFSALHTDHRLASITAVLDVIVGADDMPRFVANARRLERVVPRCRTTVVPRTGHLPLQERPDACLPVLRAALGAPGGRTEMSEHDPDG
jgi:pimeloyl-ACP methyl ester carboxylesterase